MELESKLAAYRAKKNREAKLNQVKESFKKFVKWNKSKDDSKDYEEQQEHLIEDCTPEIEIKPEIIDSIKPEEPLENPPINSVLKNTIYLTGFITWCSLYYFFIRLEFGIIYLIISALFGIYFNTRTGPKDENEISAYSVFNKNCESIDGTLKGEQFEREIRYGGLL